MVTASEALQRLVEGNRRFISGEGGRDLDFEHSRRRELVEGQAPFAVVLGCSDSRVPLELVFDQGLGDLFVVRVAGNVALPSQVGSIEFAVEQFRTPLVVVMGHSQCGAIAATVDEVLDPGGPLTPNLARLAERILPAVSTLLERNPEAGRDELIEGAVAENVRCVVAALTRDSELLAQRVRQGHLMLVGAEYSLESGEVNFFDHNA
jgi:carbonic anhydrase